MGLATPHHRTPIRDSHRSTLGDRRPGQHLGSIGSAVAIAVPAARDTGAGDRMANRVAADRRRSGPPRGEGAKIPADGKKMPLDKKMRPQSIGCGPSPRRKPAQSGARARTLNENAVMLKPGLVLKGRRSSSLRCCACGSAAPLSPRRARPEKSDQRRLHVRHRGSRSAADPHPSRGRGARTRAWNMRLMVYLKGRRFDVVLRCGKRPEEWAPL